VKARTLSRRVRRLRRRARINAGLAALLRAGEKLVTSYCCDVAGCACPPTHNCAEIECKPVARLGNTRRAAHPSPDSPRAPGFDRCLQCDAVWERRDYRTDPLVMVRASSRAV
jgi:hypothetical protein